MSGQDFEIETSSVYNGKQKETEVKLKLWLSKTATEHRQNNTRSRRATPTYGATPTTAIIPGPDFRKVTRWS